jgi:hypothetical protein
LKSRIVARVAPLAFLLAIVCVLPVSTIFADQVVYFVNGKAIIVKSIEKGEKFSILEMEGGGRIGVPTDQIVRIEEYEISTPTPVPIVAGPVAQPAPVAAAPVFAQPQAEAPAVPVAAATATPGPGVGGMPLAPGRSMDMLNPLEIGGDGSAPAPRPAGSPRPGARGGYGRVGQAMGGPGGISGGAMSRPAAGALGRRPAFGARGGQPRVRPLAAIPPSTPQGQAPVVETKPEPVVDPPVDDNPTEAPPEEPQPEEEDQTPPEEGQSPAGPPSR